MAPNKGTAEVTDAAVIKAEIANKTPALFIVKPQRGRAAVTDGTPGGYHRPSFFRAPQNRHRMAASWISSAQNSHLTADTFR
jgi:hypothetical protein